MKIFSKRHKLSKLQKQAKKEKRQETPTIQDNRFKSIHYDPKFLPASKKISKTQIDDRFTGLFKDKRFSVISEKDKYGRDVEGTEENEEMKRLYCLSNEKDKKKEGKKNKKIKNLSKSSKENKSEEIHQKYYNEQGKFEWNEESSSEDEQDPEDLNDDVWEDEEKVVRNESSSSKLALLSYDWMHINAEDIMALFNSLKPKEGIIKRVIVYPSEFGLKRMEIENKEGPSEIWRGDEEPKHNEEKPNNSQKKKKSKTIEKDINEWIAKVNKPTDFDPIKLRKYEKDRLKYYYAIIECDSKQTAEHIYSECDGTEFELTGMKIDLRFVPEKTKFPYEPKETCDYIPVTGKVNNFLNRSTNHTNVELTWENPNMNRFDHLYSKKMTEDDWNKIDYSKIIGDVDESGDSEAAKEDIDVRDKEVSSDDSNNDWRADFDKKNKRREGNMEIKFSSGFADIGNKILEKKKEKEESTWEKYLRVKKEKKKARKLLEKNKMKEEDYFIEPEKDHKEQAKYEDELELLVDENERKVKNMDVNVNDNRFDAIFKDPKYGINPTHKDFTIEGSGKYLKEVVDRRKKIKRD